MFDNSTVLVHRVGLVMFATFLVVASIVLINILIAMMSHSFDAIQVQKFSTKLALILCLFSHHSPRLLDVEDILSVIRCTLLLNYIQLA